MCSPCLLVQKVAVSFYGQYSEIEIITISYFVACLINDLLTVSIYSFYSILKVVMKPFDINQNKATFQDNKC